MISHHIYVVLNKLSGDTLRTYLRVNMSIFYPLVVASMGDHCLNPLYIGGCRMIIFLSSFLHWLVVFFTKKEVFLLPTTFHPYEYGFMASLFIQDGIMHHVYLRCSNRPKFGQLGPLKPTVYPFDMSLSVWAFPCSLAQCDVQAYCAPGSDSGISQKPYSF